MGVKPPRRPTEYVFRTYGEIVCFLPLALVGVILHVALNMGLEPRVATWTYLIVAAVTIYMVSVDTDWKQTLAIFFIALAVWAVAKLIGIVFLTAIAEWLDQLEPLVSPGAMSIITMFIVLIFCLVWVWQRLNYYEVSSNLIEAVAAGHKEWSESMEGLTILMYYDNWFKMLFLGMGKILIQRNNRTVQIIEDVPMLAWGISRKIDRLRAHRDVALVQTAEPE